MAIDLSNFEDGFVIWYRTLDNLERLAVNYWLTTGDTRLIDALRQRSERLQRFNYQSVPYRRDEFALHRAEVILREM